MRKIFFTLLWVIAAFPLLAQNAAIKGIITAEHSKSPIVGAKIRLANQDISTTTNAQGEFSLQLLQPIDEEVIISTISPFCGTRSIGTITPFIFAPTILFPTALCMEYAKSMTVEPSGRDITSPLGVKQ